MLNCKRLSVSSLAALFLLLAGCSGDSRDFLLPERVSMEAVIEGTFDEVFVAQDGTVGYGSTEPGGAGTAILSARTESHGTARSVGIWRYGANRFATGSYALELMDPSAVEAGVRFEFRREVDGVLDRFVADRGTLEVTESTTKRLAGTFEVEAFRYCRETLGPYGYTPVDGPCQIPGETMEGAPRVTVTGRFTAEGL